MTSLFSLDYAYISQLVTNGSTYLILNMSDIKERFSSYTTEIKSLDTGALLDTLVCDDERVDCEVNEEGLNKLVKNFWESGQLWGEITANMFNAYINTNE